MKCDCLRPELANCDICGSHVKQLGYSYCATCDDVIDHLAGISETQSQALLDKATHRRGLITEATNDPPK